MQRSAISSGWTTILVSKLNHAWDLHKGDADYDDVGSGGGSGGCLGLYECFQIHNQVHRPSSLSCGVRIKWQKFDIMLLLVAFAFLHVIGFFDGQVECLLVGLIKGVFECIRWFYVINIIDIHKDMPKILLKTTLLD